MVAKSTSATPATGGDQQQQVLARVLKEAIKSGKYTIGSREVISEMKSSKLIITANSLGGERSASKAVLMQAEKNKVPVVKVERSSAQLGKMIGRPFRVSAIALRVVAEGDFRQLVGSSSSSSQAAKTAE